MARSYSLTPRPVPRVESKYRRIATDIPAPQTVAVLEALHRYEPVAMQGQPPILWDHAEGFQVWDGAGNCWIDWTSGVLITNAGHGRQEIIDAVVAQAQHKLLTNYCFPNHPRMRLVEKLATMFGEENRKVFLLTTGSEAVECSIKICRTHGVKAGGRRKNVVVSFEKSFHGRTLGSQQAGGIPSLKEWIVNLDPGFVQVPFPDGFRTPDTSFDFFLRALQEQNVQPAEVCGVMLETYQGGSGSFAPVEFMRNLRAWCTAHRALLVCDEVQAGFGRTGKLAGYQHYGILPDLSTWGKGISSSLPISCVIGWSHLMDLHPPGSMTSTHTGNPVCCAAALANIDLILREDLTGNAASVGNLMHGRLRTMKQRHPEIGCVDGKGLVAGVACIRPGSKEPDADLAWDVIEAAADRGVLMFSPVGYGGGTIKICPPLCITEEAMNDSLDVFEDAFHAVLARRRMAA
ncbi:MAG: aminotransferase class III-fold pyridoxal phosphate-dependent enzyme [Acidobacteria bacterium]|nr:aminotransferase class III-fold pyridoxal phosphate-dependent enzyme [Acidobacteriota bacterium]